jgi:DUF4097 and DUF4098 domain-containing protein YvlB
MATQRRSSGLFFGLVLLSVGVLLLLHNYGNLDITDLFWHWWPLLIIFWGGVKLYERTAGRRFGGGDGGITAGEVLLVLGMLALLGAVVGWDIGKQKLGGAIDIGDKYSYDVDVEPKKIPANARVLVRTGRGDITVRGSDDAEIHVMAKKSARSWSESEAERMAKPVTVEIAENGDGYEVRPAGYKLSDTRIGVELEVTIPSKALLSVKTEAGNVTISGMASDVAVSEANGNVEVRETKGDVNVDIRKGNVAISDTQGDVKISGKGGDVEVNDTTGNLSVEGDFYGTVRADKATKGVRYISLKTDLTIASLAGHLEAGTGNMDLVDVPGNLNLRTRDSEISLENPGGKVNIDNRNAEINVRFSSAPKEDVQITNSSSAIALTLPSNANFDVSADCRNCEIDSEFPGLNVSKAESGDSHLSGKNGSGKGPKITLKTSYGNISLERNSISVAPHPPAPPVPHVPVPRVEIPAPTEQ